MITNADQSLYLRRLRFSEELEQAFQPWYYANIRNTLRVALAPVAAFVLFFAVRDFVFGQVPGYALGANGLVIALCLLLFGLTFRRGFGRVWQPVTAVIMWVAMTIMLNGPVVVANHRPPEDQPAALRLSRPPDASPDAAGARAAPPPSSAAGSGVPGARGNGPNDQIEAVQLYTILLCLVALRLPFRWATLLNSGLLASAVWILTARLHASGMVFAMFVERSLLVIFTLMISSLVQERLARSAFLANYLLDQERNDERRKREQTEGMLRVLGQAIGGIVHDLGNPLSAVQGGAQLLEQFIGEGENDKATLQELTGMIIEGAQLLDYQRVSLMEQTRVLEGKPIPIAPHAASLRRMIEAGARFQQPKFASGRRIVLDEGDAPLCVDEIKVISVFMNLIGNAMKYSDGEIRILWRVQEGKVLAAVADQGRAGKGISELQAQNLFVAFGRLETHAKVEGTGLGLLSARKIVEAHGGEIFIEGYADGTPDSAPFTSAQRAYPSLLPEGFRTAFVAVLPIDQDEQKI